MSIQKNCSFDLRKNGNPACHHFRNSDLPWNGIGSRKSFIRKSNIVEYPATVQQIIESVVTLELAETASLQYLFIREKQKRQLVR